MTTLIEHYLRMATSDASRDRYSLHCHNLTYAVRAAYSNTQFTIVNRKYRGRFRVQISVSSLFARRCCPTWCSKLDFRNLFAGRTLFSNAFLSIMDSLLKLKHYLDRSLPEEVQQKLKRLSDLNKEILEVLRANNRMQNHLLKNIDRMSRSKKVRYLNIIQQQFDTINRYADEKVKISNDAYGFVDKLVRKVDVNILQFESEMIEKFIDNTNGEGSSLNVKQEISEQSNKARMASDVVSSINSNSYVARHTKEGESTINPLVNARVTHIAKAWIMPVDPNEPKYCLCDQVSYGEMIGCDNPDCSIEWFHFECVNIITKPEGQWFCPKCKKDGENN